MLLLLLKENNEQIYNNEEWQFEIDKYSSFN